MSSNLPPAGVSPAAGWEDVTFPEPPKPLGILADSIDVRTGEITSLTARVHPVDAAIREQFRLELGSGVALANDGQGFRRIEYVTEGAQRQVQDEAMRILKPFIARGHIEILNFEVQVPPEGGDETAAQTLVHYRNRLAAEAARVGVPS